MKLKEKTSVETFSVYDRSDLAFVKKLMVFLQHVNVFSFHFSASIASLTEVL